MDRDVALAAVKSWHGALDIVDESFRKDKEFVLAAVIIDGLKILGVDKSFLKDKEVVIEALKQVAEKEIRVKKENDVDPLMTSKDKENASNFYPVRLFLDELNLDEDLKKDPEILKIVKLLN